jgi:dTMP kinase
MTAGKFITFEGGEGSGKSTQARILAERLRQRGLDVKVTREPGGSPFAERLRQMLLDPDVPPHSAMSEALLFYAARADHLETVIRPALTLGTWVVCDRFSDSTRVYQGHAGKLNPQIVQALDLLVVGKSRPDLTLIIDVPVETGLARAQLRLVQKQAQQQTKDIASSSAPRDVHPLVTDRYEARDVEFHTRLRQGFLDIAIAEPARCTVIDGHHDSAVVAASVWAAVRTRLLAEAA